MKRVLLLLICILLSPWNSPIWALEDSEYIDLTKGNWEYRWGDDFPSESTKEWQSISFPSNPPNRNNRENVWYRLTLPQSLPPEPTLYIFSIDLIGEVYFQEKRIYHFGAFDENGKGEFEGWPWHMISLPHEAAGEHLYFRIYSDYPDIGLWGEISIASKSSHIKAMLDADLLRLSAGSIALFLGVLFTIIFLFGRTKIALFLLGSLFFTQGADLLLSTKIVQFYFNYPLLKQNILAFSYFYLPLGIGAFLEQLIKNRFTILFRRIWQAHFIFIIGAFSLVLLGVQSISSLYVYYDYLHYSLTFPLLIFLMFYTIYRGNKDEKIVALGLLVLLLSWAYSSLIAWGIVNWQEHPNYLHTFVCLILFAYVLARNMSHAQELELTNKKLTQTNQALQEAHVKLTKLATFDTLTGLYNRNKINEYLQDELNLANRYDSYFGLILLDIDDFKVINDTFGHLAGDEILIGTAICLKSQLRQTDILARWGGEEFMVLCRKSNLQETKEIAEKLQLAIQKHPFPHVKSLSASFGVSVFHKGDDEKALFIKIDNALYRAKAQGKNRVEVEL